MCIASEHTVSLGSGMEHSVCYIYATKESGRRGAKLLISIVQIRDPRSGHFLHFYFSISTIPRQLVVIMIKGFYTIGYRFEEVGQDMLY